MRTPTLAAAVLSLIACSPEALRGVDDGSSEASVKELSHSVSVRFDGTAAKLTVTRLLRNDSPDYEQLTHAVPLPEGTIANGLRINADGRWRSERLLSSDDADQQWTTLTGPGEAAPSTLGLLGWSSQSGVELKLFGMAPGATVTVEYDLELPLTYQAGGWQFDYPAADWTAEPQFHFPGSLGATAQALTDDVPGFRIRQPRAALDTAEAHWATYPLDADRTLWRLELDAAQQLESLPVRPNVVFVIDASHSEGPKGIAAQLELLPGYLAHVPDAQVEIVLYRRFAERLFGRFLPASEVVARLQSEPSKLLPGNGSNLELGARLAADALREAGGNGRIVLFTDEKVRDGFSNSEAIEALARTPAGTVVHLVARADSFEGELEESRDDGAALAPIAAAGGGVFLRVFGHAEDPALLAQTMLGLVRPIRIDDFAIEAQGLELEVPAQLAEGSTLREAAIAEHPPEQVTVTGKIWAREFRRVVTTDFELADRMPGLAIGSEALRSQLTEDETRTAAMAARAVSPYTSYTSYFSAPVDAAPSTIGSPEGESFGDLGGYGFGLSGCGCGSHCGIRIGQVEPDFSSALRELLAPGLERCGATEFSLRLEATGDEVVAVEATGATAQLSACITEAAWALRLTPIFTRHRTYELR